MIALSSDGEIYTWGFNIYGQLGLIHNSTVYQPRRVNSYNYYNYLPQIVKVACSKYATFAIDMNGRPYAWGDGYIGFGNKTSN